MHLGMKLHRARLRTRELLAAGPTVLPAVRECYKLFEVLCKRRSQQRFEMIRPFHAAIPPHFSLHVPHSRTLGTATQPLDATRFFRQAVTVASTGDRLAPVVRTMKRKDRMMTIDGMLQAPDPSGRSCRAAFETGMPTQVEPERAVARSFARRSRSRRFLDGPYPSSTYARDGRSPDWLHNI
jgi:hypothetical protein